MSTLDTARMQRVATALDANNAAIRAKGVTVPEGTKLDEQAALIAQIETGGYTAGDFLDPSMPKGVVYSERNIANDKYGFYGRKGITKVIIPEATGISDSAFMLCTALEAVEAPKVFSCGAASFNGCTKYKYAVFPRLLTVYTSVFFGCTSLLAADFGGSPSSSQGFIRATSFQNDSKLSILVLRASVVWTLSYINVFQGTPFASGKSGGKLYVPSAMIEAYQSATNWSTILGYANNQILPIEGSIYETQYVDGTPIA